MAKVISTNGSISSGMQVGAAISQAYADCGAPQNSLQINTYTAIVKNGGTATITGPNGTAQVIAEPKDSGIFGGNSGGYSLPPASTPSEKNWQIFQLGVIASWFIVPLAALSLFGVKIGVFWTFVCAYMLISYYIKMKKQDTE